MRGIAGMGRPGTGADDARYAHHCGFCGYARPAGSATVLEPSCPRCGSLLGAVDAVDLPTVQAEAMETPVPEQDPGDAGGLLALLLSLPWLLPLAGIHLGDLAAAIPLALSVLATERCLAAARADRTMALGWLLVAAGTADGALTSGLSLAGGLLWSPLSSVAFVVGALASVLLLCAAVVFTRARLASGREDALVDAGLLALLPCAAVLWFVVFPAFAHGAITTTMVVLVDLAALVTFALSLAARGERRANLALRWLALGITSLLAGDAVAALADAGLTSLDFSVTAVLWGAGCYALACAADHGELRADFGRRDDAEMPPRRWIVWRLLVPMAAVSCFPVVALILEATGSLPVLGWLYWGTFFACGVVLAVGRQAWLLVERQEAVVRERRHAAEATRRNEELEALTGLATTMTQTLEEAPIIERALAVLCTAGRATSAALHAYDEAGALVLRATTGDWSLEHAWGGAPEPGEGLPALRERGGRHVLRLALGARGHDIGVVTLVRPAASPFTQDDIRLLALLVDEMGVAVQNARDYREKLEQAIRDPLTGLYNRRFFLEALEKEVNRSERYGTEASLVIFDVDDFKSVNDTFGHAAGDDVLRRVATLGEELVRPSDSFARIGGEEFALLLPETSQLEALLVADRVRTAIGREQVLEGRRVTLSGGIASCPVDGGTLDELQRRADAALYWAKRHGKDLCAVASEVTETEASPMDGTFGHLYALVAMIDAQHLHTRDHSENVAAYAVAVAQRLGMPREHIVRLRRAALLHDVGKLAVHSSILAKPAGLTDDEFEIMRRHSTVGGVILAHAGLVEEARWVRHHHERMDGRGYPDGLAGDEVPLESRIIFVADAFEAMTSDRPYRTGMPVADAVEELRRCAGTQFDPAVVDAFAALVEAGALSVQALRHAPAGGGAVGSSPSPADSSRAT